jgi:hypothetical protein
MKKKLIHIAIANAFVAITATNVYASESFIDLVQMHTPAPQVYEANNLPVGEIAQDKILVAVSNVSDALEPVGYEDNIPIQAEKATTFNVKAEELSGDVVVVKKVDVTFDEDVKVAAIESDAAKPADSKKKSIESPERLTKPLDKADAVSSKLPNQVKNTVGDSSDISLKVNSHINSYEFSTSNTLELPIFVARHQAPDGANVLKIKEHVKNGGIIKLEGLSGSVGEKHRIKWANTRAREMARLLVRSGVNLASIKIVQVREYKETEDHPGVILTLSNKEISKS